MDAIQSFLNLMLVAQADAAISAGTDPLATSGQGDEQWGTYLYGAAFVLGIFVVPFILSSMITKMIRMPQHSFRLGVMLAAIFGGLLFAWGQNFQLRLGPDMKGGTNLVYDIEPDENGEKVDAGSLSSALSDRLNPSGTNEMTIRPRGESQIEITVPAVDDGELRRIKRLLSDSGQLEFRIVANTRDHADIIERARVEAENSAIVSRDVKNAAGEVIGRWYTVGREEKMVNGVRPFKTPVNGDILRNSVTGKLIVNPPLNFEEDNALAQWMKREGIRDIDVLMAFENAGRPYAVVNGDDLASATMGFGKSGYEVEFNLATVGANKMLRLTAANQPDGNFHRRMAIIMDGRVLSAPQLNSPISTNGVITGNFSREEVDFLVTILRSGRLPATLSEKPASEQRVGAGLGATTVSKGTSASIFAIIATFVCMLLYYRFSGIVASLALVINGLLIFGIMIFIGQPLTLPGLAGLVLTVGMSVDANVLIFERIREEKSKGSAPRMAIRNGFDRAFTTIVDANLTTLIAAVVLYWIGTDQVRGFAVALIIGILTSLFTATFCSRIVFEIAEKLKFVSLSMSDGVGFLKDNLFGKGTINFMGWQKLCFVFSTLMIVIGIAAVSMRGRDVLNIDFTGGTSVTFQLQDPLEPEDLRALIKDILPTNQNNEPVQFTLVNVEKEPENTIYTMVCSIDDEEYLSKQIAEGFSEKTVKLRSYKVNVLNTSTSSAQLQRSPRFSTVRLVSYQEPAAQEEGQTETPAAETPATSEPTSDAAGEAPAAGDENLAVAIPSSAVTEFIIEIAGSNDDNAMMLEEDKGAKVDAETLRESILASAKATGHAMNESALELFPEPMPENWNAEDIAGYSKWKVRVPLAEEAATAVINHMQAEMAASPLWLSLSKIGSRVAGEMQQRAIAAILLSLVFIVAYIWFRFQKISYGLAAVIALVHDVLITLGVLALCHWLAGPLKFLLIEDFKIGLTEVAAFLTIIGYSLNDTIVVFDRIREVRGRSPRLTAEMINDSVNQTLSRTLLTSGTTLLTVILLYVFGGEGIHAFAFALLVGILIGTYSSIFVAAPVLLWLSKREAANQPRTSSAG